MFQNRNGFFNEIGIFLLDEFGDVFDYRDFHDCAAFSQPTQLVLQLCWFGSDRAECRFGNAAKVGRLDTLAKFARFGVLFGINDDKRHAVVLSRHAFEFGLHDAAIDHTNLQKTAQ